MPTILGGVLRGNMIALDSEPSLGLDRPCEVLVRLRSQADESWGEGLRRCAGALAEGWTPRDDEILDAITRSRREDRPTTSLE